MMCYCIYCVIVVCLCVVICNGPCIPPLVLVAPAPILLFAVPHDVLGKAIAPAHRCVVVEPELLLSVRALWIRTASLSLSPRGWATDTDSNATAPPPSTSASLSVSLLPSLSPNYHPVLIHHHHPPVVMKTSTTIPPGHRQKTRTKTRFFSQQCRPVPAVVEQSPWCSVAVPSVVPCPRLLLLQRCICPPQSLLFLLFPRRICHRCIVAVHLPPNIQLSRPWSRAVPLPLAL